MLNSNPVELYADLLVAEVSAAERPAQDPLPVDAQIAKSVLQKAVRRGMTALALRAAATLLAVNRRAFWRRLIVIALEDLGPANLETTCRIVVAATRLEFRSSAAVEWRTASILVARACGGSRDQSANDLANIASHAPELGQLKSDLSEADRRGALDLLAAGAGTLEEQGLAISLSLGADCGPGSPAHLVVDADAVFEILRDRIGGQAGLLREAFRVTGLALAPLNALIASKAEAALQSIAIGDDDLPPVTWIGEIPAFACDQYSSPGRAVIRDFVRQSSPWSAFARKWDVHPALWQQAAGEIHFRTESDRVTRRATYPAAVRLQRRSRMLGAFVPEAAVPEGLDVIQSELSLIEALRRGHLSPPTKP